MKRSSKKKQQRLRLIGAIYGRTSGDDQRQELRNLNGQVDLGKEYAEANAISVSPQHIFTDNHKSGSEIDIPGLQAMLEAASRGEFNVLLVRQMDRLSRNLAKQMIVENLLKQFEVTIIYILEQFEDTAEGRLQKNIKATVAEYERELITYRMKRGKELMVQQGYVLVNQRPPYGYDLIDRKLIPNPEQWEIVKKIYHWYVVDIRPAGWIVDQLEGVPTWADIHKHKATEKVRKRQYGQWSVSSVNNILKNPVYKGEWRFKSGDVVQVEPLVSPKMWEAAQARFELNQKGSISNTKIMALLARRGRCGICGYSMRVAGYKTSYPYYQCSGNKKGLRHDCTLPSFRQDRWDALVWDALVDLLTRPDALKDALAYNQDAEYLEELLAANENLIEQTTKEYDDHLRILPGLPQRAADSVKAEINRLDQVLNKLEEEKAKLQRQMQMVAPSNLDGYERVLAEVRKDLVRITNYPKEEKAFPLKRGILERLGITAIFLMSDGEQVVDLHHKMWPKPLRLVSIDTIFMRCYTTEH